MFGLMNNNYFLSIEDKHTPGHLLLQQDSESIHNSLDILKLIPFELELTSTPFCDTTILTYEIEFPPSEKQIGLNLLDDKSFTIPYVTDTLQNSPASHKITTQAKKYFCIIDING